MKNLCIRFAKTEWSKLCGHKDYNVTNVRKCKTMNEAEVHLTEMHTMTTGEESVQIIVSDNIREYYTEYFWWISTED
jgi:hypothetical protein